MLDHINYQFNSYKFYIFYYTMNPKYALQGKIKKKLKEKRRGLWGP
jgi:hypothetical protein